MRDSDPPPPARATFPRYQPLQILILWALAGILIISAARITIEHVRACRANTPLSLNDSFIINVNDASVAELMLLPGIGEKKAPAIVEYRKQHAGFQFRSLDDLQRVSGIGPKICAGLRGKVRFDVQSSPPCSNDRTP